MLCRIVYECGILPCMKKYSYQISNILLTALLLVGMAAIYLYAGKQEKDLIEQKNSESEMQTSQAAEYSHDGRLRDAVLATFSDLGYTLHEQSTDTVTITDEEIAFSAVAVLSMQGDRVNGITLRIPLPVEPRTQKNPTLIEQALIQRYERDRENMKIAPVPLLRAAIDAIDPYGEVPATARLYWEALLTEAASGDHKASDAGEAIRFRVYELETDLGTDLCVSLQIK